MRSILLERVRGAHFLVLRLICFILVISLYSCKRKTAIQQSSKNEISSQSLSTLYQSKHLTRIPESNLLAHLSHEGSASEKYYHLQDAKTGDLYVLNESSEEGISDGSFKLVNAYQTYESYKGDKWDAMNLKVENAIPVKPNTLYTFSIQMKVPQVSFAKLRNEPSHKFYCKCMARTKHDFYNSRKYR